MQPSIIKAHSKAFLDLRRSCWILGPRVVCRNAKYEPSKRAQATTVTNLISCWIYAFTGGRLKDLTTWCCRLPWRSDQWIPQEDWTTSTRKNRYVDGMTWHEIRVLYIYIYKGGGRWFVTPRNTHISRSRPKIGSAASEWHLPGASVQSLPNGQRELFHDASERRTNEGSMYRCILCQCSIYLSAKVDTVNDKSDNLYIKL